MKVHLARGAGEGGRSKCRYTSRPSRRVRLLPLDEFLALGKDSQCMECARAAALLGRSAGEAAHPRPPTDEVSDGGST